MGLFLKIKLGVVTFEVDSMDEVLDIIKEKNLDIKQVEIEQCTTKDVTSTILNLLKSNDTMRDIREKNRKEHNLKQFSSQFKENDFELPYDFDLVFDIKSEGEIAFSLKRDGFLCDSLEEMCLDYGFTREYLENLPLIEVE